MNLLDLFSGLGGFSRGMGAAGISTVAFCEIDKFCQKVLTKNFPGIPIFENIKTLTVEKLNGAQIDIVCGGFPCQPFSVAGKKRGKQDDRDLWPEMFRVIKEVRPTWVVGENVANFINMEFTRTKVDLESIGYEVLPFIIPACGVGAQHNRKRIWIVAHINRANIREKQVGKQQEQDQAIARYDGEEEFASDVDGKGVGRYGRPIGNDAKHAKRGSIGTQKSSSNSDNNGFCQEANAAKEENSEGSWENNGGPKTTSDFGQWWATESGVGRTIYGFSDRVDRYRKQRIAALGNSIVPQIAYIIGSRIMELTNANRL